MRVNQDIAMKGFEAPDQVELSGANASAAKEDTGAVVCRPQKRVQAWSY
jgi:hypothetical protein